MKNIIHLLGWLFIVAGVIGLFLPFLQGIALLVLGIALISFLSPRTQQKVEYFKKVLGHYWPAGARFLAVLEQKCETVLVRIMRFRKGK
ncbi:MAG: PGPGW domain-containing protein [bacterium]|nr:PGPGW domain-containing protein [bacterium]